MTDIMIRFGFDDFTYIRR